MTKRGLIAIFTIILAASGACSFALPSVGPQPKTQNQITNVRNPMNWIGKKFILLDQPPNLQSYGYQALRIHQDDDDIGLNPSDQNPDYEDDLGSLRYDKFHGDVITITSVKPDSDVGTEYDIIFNDETKGFPVYATTTDGCIDDIAPLTELAQAKAIWVGKTIWSKRRYLWQYNALTGDISSLRIPLGENLKVMDVSWGDDTDTPIWLIVKRPNGEEGYYEIACDPTNKSPALYDQLAYWGANFYDHNPRADYADWPDAVWNKITRGTPALGMTYEQVRLTIGNPDKINRDTYQSGTTEQWVYKDRYVYLRRGKVSAIQDRP